MVSVSSIYSTLGNSSSLVPLAIKDIANSCGLTAASYMAGDKNEGKDRFIDEFGTQAIWLWGIPGYKLLLDFLIKHVAKFDPNIDVRILSNDKIANLAKDFAPNDEIKSGIETAIKKVLVCAQSEDKTELNKLMSQVYQLCDKAVGKGILHKNTAARKKSRLTKAVNKLTTK